jgi:hypothetical protein
MSKYLVEPGRSQTTVWRRVASWISKATRAQPHARGSAATSTYTRTHLLTHTHKYTIFIAFPQQQWFREPS